MRKEYFDIALRINLLFKQSNENIINSDLKILQLKMGALFIRIELFHEFEYYQNLIQVTSKDISIAVSNKDFAFASRCRSKIAFLEKRKQKSVLNFQGYNAPCCIIDKNGLAKCYLNSEDHKNLLLIEKLK